MRRLVAKLNLKLVRSIFIKLNFEQTPSGNLNVSITGVSIKNWDNINGSEDNTIIPGTLKFDKLYLASGFTDWGQPYEMFERRRWENLYLDRKCNR